MQHRLYLIIFIVLLMALPAGVCAQTTVAVMPFEGEEIRDWYIDRQQMINGITATFTDQLSSLGDVRVVERSRLDQILREQDFGYSGRVDTFHAAEIGRLLGADLLILGTVQAIELKESGGIQISMLRAKGTTAKIELSIRVVDTETGVILGSVQASGSNTGASFAVNNLFGVSFYSDAFKNSVLGKALGQAVEELVTNFSEELHAFTTPREELVGRILAVVGDKYVINLGDLHNVKRGDRFEVYEVVNVAGLTKPVEIPVGNLRIISVDEEACVGEAEGDALKEGYVVRKE